MIWDFQGLTIAGQSNDAELMGTWALAFASRPAGKGVPDLVVQLDRVTALTGLPRTAPDFALPGFIAYHLDRPGVTAVLPELAILRLDLLAGETRGQVTDTILRQYGALEDVVAIALAPHLRRRGRFMVHAFAAAKRGAGLLLVGGQGAGKTTTGLALLEAGWQLLANDAPVLAPGGMILSYPGLLGAYPATLSQFAATSPLVVQAELPGRRKISLPFESIWPTVWLDQAPLRAVVFLQIEPRGAHMLERASAAESLRRLLPHTLEQWDREMLAPQFRFLRQLADETPGYILRLADDVKSLPELLEATLVDHLQ